MGNAFSENWQSNLLLSLVFLGLTMLFYVMRRVKFDDENIYRIYGRREKAVPFSTVIRIEKSGTAINSRKMWRLRYDTKEGEKSFLFIDGIFQHGSVKELMAAVRKVKPDVEIEESYIWNQWEHQKRRKAKKRAEKEKKA